MAVDAETRRRIERQAKLYEAAKDEAITRIQGNVRVAIEKLKAAEKTLMNEVSAEFGENPFEELLVKISSENPPTDAEVRRALARGIPKDIGPSEESFCSLVKEIEAFKSWRAKAEKPSVPTLSSISVQSVTQDSITLTWDAAEGASSYQIEVDGGKTPGRI